MTSPYAGLWSLLLILLALLLPDLLSAQSIPSDYGGYRYDSNFTIAGYDVNRTWLLPLVKDELGFSTLVSYTLPTALDPTSIATALLRGDSSVGITRKLLDFLFDSMGTGGSAPALKLMGIPSTISAISKNATSMEAYPDYLFQIVQTGSFDYVTTAGSADTTFTPRHFVKGRDVRPDTSGVSTTVVDRPRYTQRAFRDPVPYPYAVLDTIYGGVARRPGDDAAGVYEGLADVVPGYADSSRYYYAEVTLSLPQYADIAEDSTTLFIVTLLRRDTLRQTGPGQCRCNLVTPFATLRVRKGNVTQLSENAGDDYVKLGLWFSSIWRIAGGDTVWVSSPFNKGLIQAGTGPGTSRGAGPVSVMQRVVRGSEALDWLTSEPYDSVLGEPHDVRVVTELVNDANGAVLWRSDTVSARTMTSDTLERTLSIPSNLADSGTVMYVRMRGMPTYGLSVECTGGFIWTYEDEASSMSRPVAPLGDRGARSAAVRSTIEMTIAPNPAHGHATLFARVPRQGAYRLSVVDERGTERAHFDDVEFRAVAEARFDLDVSVLPTGHYFVRIEALDGSGSGTTPLSVRR